MIHYFIHNSSPKDGSYMYIMKRYHASHHFKEPYQGDIKFYGSLLLAHNTFTIRFESMLYFRLENKNFDHV